MGGAGTMTTLAALLCHGRTGMVRVAVGTVHHELHRRMLSDIVAAHAQRRSLTGIGSRLVSTIRHRRGMTQAAPPQSQ